MKTNTNTLPLDEGTWQITDGSSISRAYIYLLVGEQQAMLVDTGLGNIDLASIVRPLTNKPVLVINTHGHLDHISANHQFENVYLHPADESVFAEHSSYEGRRAFVLGILAEQGLPSSLLDSPDMQLQMEPMLRLPKRNNRRPLQDGDVFDLGNRHVRIIETPGHTMGSLCLLDEDRRWLFTGDTVCDEGVLLHFPHSAPLDIFVESIKKLQAMQRYFDVMWPGHHCCPLDCEILQRYLICAEQIQQGAAGELIHSAAGAARLFQHDGIALSVPV